MFLDLGIIATFFFVPLYLRMRVVTISQFQRRVGDTALAFGSMVMYG